MTQYAQGLPQPYPHEERVKARAGYRRIDHIADVVRDCLVRAKPLPEPYVEPVKAITKTDDRAAQLQVLETISETIKEQHQGRLRALAKHDFGAFCEVINPEEPPESRFHVWLTDLLQEIEMNPDMNKLVLNVPPGHAKPLHVDTLVLTARGRLRLGDVVVGDRVMTHAGRFMPVTAVHEQGELALHRAVGGVRTGQVAQAHHVVASVVVGADVDHLIGQTLLVQRFVGGVALDASGLGVHSDRHF